MIVAFTCGDNMSQPIIHMRASLQASATVHEIVEPGTSDGLLDET